MDPAAISYSLTGRYGGWNPLRGPQGALWHGVIKEVKEHVVSSCVHDAPLLPGRKQKPHSGQFFSPFPVGNIGRSVPRAEPEPGAAAPFTRVSVKWALT